MKYYKELVLIIMGLVVMAFGVSALPATPDGATVTVGPGATYTGGTSPAGAVNATGGNYTEINASTYIQTDNWQIFYGSVSGDLVLQDASNNAAYSWAADETVTGYIFFSNESTVTWSGLVGNELGTQRQSENLGLGLGAASDNITETLAAAPAHPAIDYTGIGGAIGAGNTWAVQTNNDTAAHWYTALAWQGSAMIYVGFLDQGGRTSFTGDTADYQVMVPTSDGVNRQYYVFLAIE